MKELGAVIVVQIGVKGGLTFVVAENEDLSLSVMNEKVLCVHMI